MGATLMQLIVALISGAVGGNIAGAVLRKFSLGPIGNTVVGVLGGGLGGELLSATGLLTGDGVASDIAGSAIGGAILMIVVGLIKNAVTKQHRHA
jgi:uncharacterized membrane protein YeaQ/YmgE (transglycosylase-associated protein family)